MKGYVSDETIKKQALPQFFWHKKIEITAQKNSTRKMELLERSALMGKRGNGFQDIDTV